MATHEMQLTPHSPLTMRYNYNAHVLFCRKMAALRMAFNGGSAGSLQQSGFRENPTNMLTSVTVKYKDYVVS